MRYTITISIKRVFEITANTEAEAEAARRRIYNANRLRDQGPNNTLDVTIEPIKDQEKTS